MAWLGSTLANRWPSDGGGDQLVVVVVKAERESDGGRESLPREKKKGFRFFFSRVDTTATKRGQGRERGVEALISLS